MRRLAGLVVAFLLAALPAAAQGRLALVIGNSGYEIGALPNPRNDAALMAKTLREAGFEVTELIDAGQLDMKRAMRDFGQALRRDGVDAGLFFYAGHGVQVRGVNYLIPVDTAIRNEDDVAIEAVSIDDFLQQVNSSKSKINIVILDACRDNPFERTSRSAGRGLASVQAPAGTFIAYSTAPGTTAADGDGENSLYTAALAQSIATAGDQPIEGVFKSVRQAMRDTGSEQTPWEASSIVGDFYFHPKVDGAAPAADEVSTAWSTIRDSSDARDYESFIAAYGERNPFLRQQAEKRLNALKNGGPAAPAPRGDADPAIGRQIAALKEGGPADPRPSAQKNGWTIYGYQVDGAVRCWAWTPPRSAEPADVVHAAVQFGVDKFGTQFSPSIIAPDELKPDVPAEARIGGETFKATMTGNIAYFSFSDAGKELASLLNGDRLSVTATLKNGRQVAYEFATEGFPAVRASMATCD